MIEVIATTKIIEHLGKSYAGPAVWEWNAQFAVVVEVVAVSGDDVPDFVKPGATVAFAVHSPTHVFAHVCAADEAVDNRFRFELERVDPKWWRVIARKSSAT